jgi:putative tryptophan/tyrosine transport system substrate-binding protein
MRRRDFITALASAATWISVARGQEPRYVIGYLSGFSDASPYPGSLAAFYKGLKETGFVEGRDISIEFRWADGHYDHLPSLAAELVNRNVAVILASDLPAAFAARAATKTIPIVFVTGADPVKVGLVESFSRPTGNLTGVSVFLVALGPKHVEFLHELVPSTTIALLGNPENANFESEVPDIRAAAEALKQRLEVLTASTESELEAAFCDHGSTSSRCAHPNAGPIFGLPARTGC